MRIDLPRCNLDTCRWHLDGNCVHESEYKNCRYKALKFVCDHIYFILDEQETNETNKELKELISLIY